jgi:hypothetical protein
VTSKKEKEQNIELLEVTLQRMVNDLKYPNRELLIDTYKRLIKEMKAELKPKKVK